MCTLVYHDNRLIKYAERLLKCLAYCTFYVIVADRGKTVAVEYIPIAFHYALLT